MKTLLAALKLAVATSDLHSLARSIRSEFFSGVETLEGKPLPLPHFKVVRHTGAKWLGRCTFKRSNPVTTTIEIQKSILNVPESLDRVLCHEMIHHADFMVNELARTKYRDGHGLYFTEMANKINAKRGKNYVTEKSDSGYAVEDLGQEIHMLIYPFNNGPELGYTVAVRPSAKQKEYIQRLLDLRDAAKLIKTKDNQWAGGPKIWGTKLAVHEGERQEVLRKLYEA